jgi:hypothetical protein
MIVYRKPPLVTVHITTFRTLQVFDSSLQDCADIVIRSVIATDHKGFFVSALAGQMKINNVKGLINGFLPTDFNSGMHMNTMVR